MKKQATYLVITVLLFFTGYFIALEKTDKDITITRSRFLMGTLVEITVTANGKALAESAISKAFEEISRVDSLLSTYIPGNPVCLFNNSRDSILFVDSELFDLLKICDSISELSKGCFDVSLENLILEWGFNTDEPHLPEKEEIKSALLKCGWNNIRFIGKNKILRSKTVRLNFGGIGKGYAVDKAMEILEKMDIKTAVINAGGDISVKGSGHLIGIRHPDKAESIIESIELNNMTIATSGDYENYFISDGICYHHIFDPFTGYPADKLRSVSVINKSNTFADALATAVFILGKDEGLKMINGLTDTEAMAVDKNGFVFYSTGFEQFLR